MSTVWKSWHYLHMHCKKENTTHCVLKLILIEWAWCWGLENEYGWKTFQLQECTLNAEEAKYKNGCVNQNKSLCLVMYTCLLTTLIERCVNWNQYYTKCTTGPTNPFNGAISFDNIGLAWVAIFLVISLEGWTDVMYFVQVLFVKIMPS